MASDTRVTYDSPRPQVLQQRLGLLQVQGELLLGQGDKGQKAQEGEESEACCQQALAVTRHQQARSLELRAAMSLARLWQQQDNSMMSPTLTLWRMPDGRMEVIKVP
jgi:hypothetical protein